MKKRLKRVEPLQLGKVLGLLYGLGSLVFLPVFLGFFALSTILPAAMGAEDTQGAPPAALFAGMGLVMLILAPVFYAFMGFITGAIGALIYNLVAKWVGGIEVEVE